MSYERYMVEVDGDRILCRAWPTDDGWVATSFRNLVDDGTLPLAYGATAEEAMLALRARLKHRKDFPLPEMPSAE